MENQMFCPKCGQRQISDEVRFCSRCGFSLNVVAKLLSGENLPALIENESPENLSLYRRATSQIGAKLIFASIVFVPVAILLGIPLDTAAFLLVSVILFIAGFAQLSYALIFGDKSPAGKNLNLSKNLSSSPAQSNLPAAQTESVPLLEIRQRETNEMTPPPPPSVTDPTTKLLEQNGKASDSKL